MGFVESFEKAFLAGVPLGATAAREDRRIKQEQNRIDARNDREDRKDLEDKQEKESIASATNSAQKYFRSNPTATKDMVAAHLKDEVGVSELFVHQATQMGELAYNKQRTDSRAKQVAMENSILNLWKQDPKAGRKLLDNMRQRGVDTGQEIITDAFYDSIKDMEVDEIGDTYTIKNVLNPEMDDKGNPLDVGVYTIVVNKKDGSKSYFPQAGTATDITKVPSAFKSMFDTLDPNKNLDESVRADLTVLAKTPDGLATTLASYNKALSKIRGLSRDKDTGLLLSGQTDHEAAVALMRQGTRTGLPTVGDLGGGVGEGGDDSLKKEPREEDKKRTPRKTARVKPGDIPSIKETGRRILGGFDPRRELPSDPRFKSSITGR
jgi:hypothetical protein